MISFRLDGRRVEAMEGETILEAADRHGVRIPRLCHKPGYRPDGNCRACVVEIAGERVLAPSCCRTVTAGMEVSAGSDRARTSQSMVLEMLLADLPDRGHKWIDDIGAEPHGELSAWAGRMEVEPRPALRRQQRSQPAGDSSHPAIAVNMEACIQCNRCVRACREEQGNDVIGMAYRGASAQIVFDLGDPLAESTCVACGECVQACPTGALMPKTLMGPQAVDREVDSVCPFCGVGCQLTYKVRDEKIVAVEGRDGPANHERLCVKGRFGFDYVHHPHRLTRPLVRKPGVPKTTEVTRDPSKWAEVFREASWEEALALAAGGLKDLRDARGPKSLAGFGSAKGSNEEAYLFQKLVRTVFGSNNVDHCTRLCHASSVAALLEGVGSGAVSNPVADVAEAELVLVIGSNPTANHPVAATWMKNAARSGTRIVLADPRVTDLARHAWRVLPFKPDTDVALINAMVHTILEEGLADTAFLQQRTSNVEALRTATSGFAPERMESVCGIPAATIREVARAFAQAKSAMILWGMGVSQHVHGTDNVRSLIALCSVAGQIGKPGSGLHPLRGQNNVQGASDAGLIPMMLPNYKPVADAAHRGWFERFWQTPLDPVPGYTVTEVMDRALADESDPHKIRGMYVMGENPAMSDPDLNHARQALAALEHLVVQDIFLTETAWLADVVLPASAWPEKTGTVTNTDRIVQLGRKAIEPPGEARADLAIIQDIASRMGARWSYAGEDSGVSAVYEEMREAMADVIAGITWDRLAREGSVTYPCLDESDPGQPVVFTDRFPTADGRLKLVPPAHLVSAAERPDAEFPLVLITGRLLEHWHTGSMTRRSAVLDALEPAATVSLNAAELQRHGVSPGDPVLLQSRRGEVRCTVRLDEGTQDRTVFLPFAFREAAANLLTNSALDPWGKIPEFKFCAVRLLPAPRT